MPGTRYRFRREKRPIMKPRERLRGTREALLDELETRIREIADLKRLLENRTQQLAEYRQQALSQDTWLRTILENAPMEIVLKDVDGRFMAFSSSIEEFYGVTAADVVGATTDEFLPAHIAETYMSADRKVMETGIPLQQEIHEETDGKIRYSLNSKFPMKDRQGKIIGVCSLTNNITEMKEAEARIARAQKIEALGKLTGGVAHDFNNLLAVIQGNAELLQENTGQHDDLVKEILGASKRGADLTDMLLDYSRLQTLRPEPTDLVQLVNGMTNVLRRVLGKSITVKTVTQEVCAPVMVDKGKVEDALLNLTINARDAMPEGGELTIECRNVSLEDASLTPTSHKITGDYVVLSVSDNGTGMPPDVQTLAFEPFFTTKQTGVGSGLGLSMVYGFVNQSDGHVTIDSAVGSGTTINIYLPQSSSPPKSKSAKPTEDIPRGSGETILVVEDNAAVRALTLKMLDSLGYRPIAAPDAAAAKSLLAEGNMPDLVLSDVVLQGGISGLEFAETIRATNPGLKIVLMSGYTAETVRQDHNLRADQAFLGKPFAMQQLANAMHTAMQDS